MSITYCHNCNKNIDEDIDVEHFESCLEESKEETHSLKPLRRDRETLLEQDDDRLVWTTKDGRKMLPKDFDDNHLLNTIKFLQKNAKNAVGNYVRRMLSYEPPKGDIASMSFDNEFEAMMKMEQEPMIYIEHNTPYLKLIEEANKRNLLTFVKRATYDFEGE